MTDERSTSYLFFRALVLALLTLISGCRDATSQKEVLLPAAKADFFIFWPPQDASENTGSSVPPLLQGEVWVTGETDAEGSSVLRIRMHLIRPSGEAERQFWNSQLSYADLDWMNEVRVWDKDNLWIWPNLPFLLRRPGSGLAETPGAATQVEDPINESADEHGVCLGTLGIRARDVSRKSPPQRSPRSD